MDLFLLTEFVVLSFPLPNAIAFGAVAAVRLREIWFYWIGLDWILFKDIKLTVNSLLQAPGSVLSGTVGLNQPNQWLTLANELHN